MRPLQLVVAVIAALILWLCGFAAFLYLSHEPWRDMASAPRDGTTIEIKNTWNVVPWYGLFRWQKAPGAREATWWTKNDGIALPEERWAPMTAALAGIDCELGPDACHWRPYTGSVEAYVDPTHGAQFTVEYWRNAR